MIQGKQPSLLLLLMGGLGLLSAHIKKQTPDCKPLKKDQTIYTQIQEQYGPMIKLIDTIDHPISKQEFKKHIMLYNDAYNKKKNNSSVKLFELYDECLYFTFASIIFFVVRLFTEFAQVTL